MIVVGCSDKAETQRMLCSRHAIEEGAACLYVVMTLVYCVLYLVIRVLIPTMLQYYDYVLDNCIQFNGPAVRSMLCSLRCELFSTTITFRPAQIPTVSW